MLDEGWLIDIRTVAAGAVAAKYLVWGRNTKNARQMIVDELHIDPDIQDWDTKIILAPISHVRLKG